jgi:hypothetical protein
MPLQLPRRVNDWVLNRSPRRTRSGDRELVGTVVPPIGGTAFLALSTFRVARWNKALRDLEATQMKQLRRILETGVGSEFGDRHGFSSIRDFETYTQRVPLGDYDSFAADCERIREGETDVLTTNRTRFICESAGSSQQGRRKYLPVSDLQIRFQQGSAVDAVHRYIHHTGDDTFTDGFIVSVFPPTAAKTHGRMKLTNNPALMMTQLPLPSQFVYLPDRERMAIDDIDGKLDVIAEHYLDHDVRTLTGTTCWFSILFDKILEAARRKGRRVDTIGELWPNLRFLVGGGVVADPYLPVLRDRVGHDVDLVDTYNATEGGVFAVSDHASDDPGLLMIPDRGVFYEFVPLEEVDASDPTRVPLWAVEKDKDYVIHMTTVSGLYSYRLGDIVRFSSLWPHRLRFSGRLSGCLSITQELTTHREVQLAMEVAQKAVPAAMVDWSVGPEIGADGTAKGRYVLMAEFLPGQAPADRHAFLKAFDDAHIAQNRAYREARHEDTAIFFPRLVELPEGSVRRFMADAGMTSLQTKFPRIVDGERMALLLGYAAS